MNELLQAAKAVINELNLDMPHDGISEEAEARLRAAVERAEKQESVGFYEWLKTWHQTNRYEGRPLAPSEKTIWIAAQQAERTKKQEADFDTWWERTYGGKTCRAFAEDAWKTAQWAERERIKKMIDDMIDQNDPWIHFSTLLEMIDGD